MILSDNNNIIHRSCTRCHIWLANYTTAYVTFKLPLDLTMCMPLILNQDILVVGGLVRRHTYVTQWQKGVKKHITAQKVTKKKRCTQKGFNSAMSFITALQSPCNKASITFTGPQPVLLPSQRMGINPGELGWIISCELIGCCVSVWACGDGCLVMASLSKDGGVH